MNPEQKWALGVDEDAVEVVRRGMGDVVSKGYGTGRSAGLSYTTVCGKTGTAQWGPPSRNQRLAWFAGFLPQDNPRYAFAVLYEGSPGQTVSGGRMAGPMVRSFFEPLKDDIKDIIAPPKRAVMVVDEVEGEVAPTGAEDGEAPAALPVDGEDLPEDLQVDEAGEDEVIIPRALPVADDEVVNDGTEEP
jgi:penicillin-binding protein 2